MLILNCFSKTSQNSTFKIRFGKLLSHVCGNELYICIYMYILLHIPLAGQVGGFPRSQNLRFRRSLLIAFAKNEHRTTDNFIGVSRRISSPTPSLCGAVWQNKPPTLKRRCTYRPSVIYLIVNKLLSLSLSCRPPLRRGAGTLSSPPPPPPGYSASATKLDTKLTGRPTACV